MIKSLFYESVEDESLRILSLFEPNSGGVNICDDLEIGGIEIVIHGDVTYLKSKFTGNYDFLAGPFCNNVLLLLVRARTGYN